MTRNHNVKHAKRSKSIVYVHNPKRKMGPTAFIVPTIKTASLEKSLDSLVCFHPFRKNKKINK